MKSHHTPTLLPIQIAVMAAVLYVASGLLFIRRHLVTGVPIAGGVTTVYLSFPDTWKTRILIQLYRPILAVTDRKTQVVWEH